jgi:hypothetical protein
MTAQLPPPGWHPDPSRGPKRRQRLLIGVGAVAVLVLLARLGSHSSNNDSSSTTTTTTTTRFYAPAAPMGQEVRDGTFAFTVTGVEKSPTVGDHTARGEYVVVSMTVTNIKRSEHGFSAADQILTDTVGDRYKARWLQASKSAGGTDWGAGYSSPHFRDGDEITPEHYIAANVIFDVPRGAQPGLIVLHDSSLSNGAPVSLTSPTTPPPTQIDTGQPMTTSAVCDGGRHSLNYLDICVPGPATLDVYGHEIWEVSASLDWTTDWMARSLPVGQLLDAPQETVTVGTFPNERSIDVPAEQLPWCGSKTDWPTTDWAWGTSTDMLDVHVTKIGDKVITMISREVPKNGVCQPGG